jgi:hypothetical protein
MTDMKKINLWFYAKWTVRIRCNAAEKRILVSVPNAEFKKKN